MEPDLIAELRPIRLPPGFDAFDFSGALAIFSIALLAGLLITLLLRLATVPKADPRRDVIELLDAAKSVQPGERLLAQARALDLLERLTPKTRRMVGSASRSRSSERLAHLRGEISDAIYRPEPKLDCDRIDLEIRDLVRAGLA